ncbi:MAG: T9SS type A sorting domain-containing protein, partial [Bacteroidota bacterium]
QADNRQTDNLVLFPNPATNEFIVTIPTELLNEKQLTLRLYNSLGELIHNEPVITGGGKITMTVGGYAKGLYQVNLGNGKKWCAGKVVIE